MNEDEIRKSLSAISMRYLLSGLNKAEAGDLSRAVSDLTKAVRYDKHNEKARNLLGLVQFQMGELGEAMLQWSISEHLNPTGNWATYYLSEIKKEQALLTNMSQSIDLYNEAVRLSDRGDTDFAMGRLKKAIRLNPNFVKAQLLLAVLCIQAQQFDEALKVLDLTAKIDPLNPEAMRYRLYVAQQKKEGVEDESVNIRDLSRDLYVQQSLPEPDIVELSRKQRKKEDIKAKRQAVRTRGLGIQIVLFLTGVVLGAASMGFLWLPQKTSQMKEQVEEMTVQDAQLEADNQELSDKVSQAGQLLKKVVEGGKDISEVTLADIKGLLKNWGVEFNEP